VLGTPLPLARAKRDLAAVRDAAGDADSARVLRTQAMAAFALYRSSEDHELARGEEISH
jgi:hypothetical protein